MPQLTPTELETITYGMPYWNYIVSTNAQRLNDIWKLDELLDVDVTGKAHGAILVFNWSTQRWVARMPPST